MNGVSKNFPGVRALSQVDLEVLPGEVMGLVGENGAGKSTLIKILSGALHADGGAITLSGVDIHRPAPADMIRRGVAVIYQELMLAPHLSVGENMWLGRLPRRRLGFVDWNEVWRRSRAVLDQLGFDLEPKALISTLSVAQRQMAEIAGALSRQARLVVLDEPSAVLGGTELDNLFTIIRRLAATGIGFIYITHRLREVFTICDRVTVLRDGKVAGSGKTADLDDQSLVRMMVGRKLDDIYPPRRRRPGDVVMSVKGMQRPPVLQDVDIEVRRGEILGLCGLAGSGRTELLRALAGADTARSQSFNLEGKSGQPASPRHAIAAGVIMLPEDRKLEGCFLPQTVSFNITISGLGRITRQGFLDMGRERALATALIGTLHIRTQGPGETIRQLSGGNQQKCLIARSLNANCRILLIDEPTRGVDVGAKREIYQLLAKLADDDGAAIIMVSSELPEILGLSDRIIVMRDGRIAATFSRDEASEESLMAAAIGLSRMNAQTPGRVLQ